MKFFQAMAFAAAVVGLAACQSSDTKPDEDQAPAPIVEGDGASTSGIDSGTSAAAAGQGASAAERQALAALEKRSIIYFDYDSSEIRSEYVDVVAAHAAFLVKYPAARVRLEGHTDERGSREYNIGLGERRAQVVRQALLLQGAKPTQVVTVSYGEERPAQNTSDESAYAQNRRVQFVYAR